MQRVIKSGDGWRLGWNPDAPEFQGLVAGEHWSIELTAAELEDFCRLLAQLAESVSLIAEELMDEERISCEAESDLLWMQVEGEAKAYSVRFILHRGRRCEGSWPASVVPELVEAGEHLKTF